MAITNTQLLEALKADLREAKTMHDDWETKRKDWLNETYGNKYGNEVEGKSQIVSKDIKKQLEWMLPGLTEPFLSTSDIIKCNPITAEDSLAAKQNQLLLNYQFCRKFARYNFIMKAARVLATEGSVVVQTSWDYKDEQLRTTTKTVQVDENTGEEYIAEVEDIVTKVLKNEPTAKVRRNEDIYIDPTCKDDMNECQFVIDKFESSYAALKADGRYKNLDDIANKEYAIKDYTANSDPDHRRQDDTNFQFKDKLRKKLIVHEYWGYYDVTGNGELDAIVCAWVGDTVIRLDSNPYPGKELPFIIVPFTPVPFQMYGEALAENIGDNQKIKTSIIRGVLDNMIKSNNGQVGILKGALDVVNQRKFRKGENFEFNTGAREAIWQGGYNELPASVFNMLGLMSNEIESHTGIKSFNSGISGVSLGNSATAARGALDATDSRKLDLVRNFSENLIKPLMRKWISYNAEFLDEEEVVRITNDQFVPIKRDDLAGRIDVELNISTSEDNAAKAQELSFLLQTLGPSQDPELMKEIMAQILDLMRMPTQAKKIREHQPQPDPMEQEQQQLTLEKLKLDLEETKASIADKLARAGENDVDRLLKIQKAKVEEAKARNLNSKSDKDDLDFIVQDEGIKHQQDLDKENQRLVAKSDELNIKHQQDMEKKEFDRQANLHQLAVQKAAGDKNLGIFNP